MSATSEEILPFALGRSYLPLLHFRDDVLLVEGRRGTGKTSSILDVLMSRAFLWPGTTFYIWRSTRKLLSDSVLQVFEQFTLPKWRPVDGMRILNPAVKRDTRTEYVLENGSRFIPDGMDSISRGQSASCAGGYLAEATELQNLRQITALLGMLRQPGADFRQLIVDCNPGPENHFLNLIGEPVDNRIRRVQTPADYERLQQHNCKPVAPSSKRWKRIITKIQDNPHFFDLSGWKLTKAGEDYESKLGHQSGHVYKNWVLGEWANAEGGVFPEFSQSNIVQPFGVPTHWPRYMVYDPGHGHPTGIAWVAMAPTGTLFVYDEVYTAGYAMSDFAHWIKSKEEAMGSIAIRRYADPRGAFSRDAKDPRSIADIMAEEHGLFFDPWPSLAGQKKRAGVEALRQRVKDGTLRVFSTCVATINEFQSWRYKHNAAGIIRVGDDAYEDSNNEIMDGLVGLVAKNPSPGISGGFVSNIPPDVDKWGDMIDEDYREPEAPVDEIRPPGGGFSMVR